ncbi:MAG TPA: hypothetical protein VII66_03250 [Gemmatimonadaceae bacterium]
MRTLFFQSASSGPEPDGVVRAHSDKFFCAQPDTRFTPRTVKLIARVHGHLVRSTGIRGEVFPLKVMLVIAAATLDATESGYENITVYNDEVRHVRQLTPAETVMVRVENPTDTPWDARVMIIGGSADFDGEESMLGLSPKRDETISRRLRVPARGSVSSSLSPHWDCSPRRITMHSDSQLDVTVQCMQVCNVSLFAGAQIPVEMFDGGFDLKTVNMTPANRMTVTLYNSGDCDRHVEIAVDVDAPHVREVTGSGARIAELRATAARPRFDEQQHGGPQAPR